MVRAGSAILAGCIAGYDAVGAYYSYDAKQKIVGKNSTDTKAEAPLMVATTLQATSAVLLAAAIPTAFIWKKGTDFATGISAISFLLWLGGSFANSAAYQFEHREYPVPFAISMGGILANFLPVIGYFFTRAVIDPGVRHVSEA